jgi:hypothetical protein
MISTGENIDTFSDATEESLNQFLNLDIENNKKGVWSKLSKTEKIKKIKSYVKDTLTKTHSLNEEEAATAIRFFVLMIERKKLSKNNELSYNQENGNIDQIGGLLFNTESRKFTITIEPAQSKKKTKKII